MPLRPRAGRQSNEAATTVHRKRRSTEATSRTSSDANTRAATMGDSTGRLPEESRNPRAVRGRSLERSVGVQSKAQVVSASREGGTQTRSSRSTRQVAASRERAMSSTLRKVGVSAESTVDEHHASTGRNQPSSGRGTTAARPRTRKSDGTVQGSDRRGVRASGRELSDRAVDKASTWTPSRSSGNETDDDDDDDESSISSVNASTTETTSRHGRARAAARVHGSEQDDQMLETPLSMEEKETRRLELENELVWLRQEAALLVQVAQMIPSIPNGELKSQLGVIETESAARNELSADEQSTLQQIRSGTGPMKSLRWDSMEALVEAREQAAELVQNTAERLRTQTSTNPTEPFWLVHQFIADLFDLERRREALQERIMRNYGLQLAFLEQYAQARFREAQHQRCVSEEALRERFLEAAFRRQRQRRVAGQLHRDPMVLFGQPPVMIPPGFAGVPYQLLPPRPIRNKTATTGMPFAPAAEEGLQLLERRPVSLGLEPEDASGDLRHVQKAITALRRKARASNSGTGVAGGSSGLSARPGTSVSKKTLNANGAGRATNGPVSRQTSTRGRGTGRPSASGRRSRDQSTGENGLSTQQRASETARGAPGAMLTPSIIEPSADVNDEERRARLAVGLIHRDQAYETLDAKTGDTKGKVEGAGSVSAFSRRTPAATNATGGLRDNVTGIPVAAGKDVGAVAGTAGRSISKRGRPRKRNAEQGEQAIENAPSSKPMAKKPPKSAASSRHGAREAAVSSSSSSSSIEVAQDAKEETRSTEAPEQHVVDDPFSQQVEAEAQTQTDIERILVDEPAANTDATVLAPTTQVETLSASAVSRTEHTTLSHLEPGNDPIQLADTEEGDLSSEPLVDQQAFSLWSKPSEDMETVCDVPKPMTEAVGRAEQPPSPLHPMNANSSVEFPIGGDPDAFVSRGTLFYRGMQLHKGDQVAIRVLPKGSTSGAVHVGLASGSPEAQADIEAAEIYQGPLVSLNVKELHVQDAEHRVYVTWLQSGRAELIYLGKAAA